MKPSDSSTSFQDELKSFVMQSSVSIACKVAILLLIKNSERLSRSVRMVIFSSSDDRKNEFVRTYQKVLDEFKVFYTELNDWMRAQDDSCTAMFEWDCYRGSYIFYFSPQGGQKWNQIEQEIASNLIGESLTFSVRLGCFHSEPKNPISFIEIGCRGVSETSWRFCERAIGSAFATLVELQKAFPRARVEFYNDGKWIVNEMPDNTALITAVVSTL